MARVPCEQDLAAKANAEEGSVTDNESVLTVTVKGHDEDSEEFARAMNELIDIFSDLFPGTKLLCVKHVEDE